MSTVKTKKKKQNKKITFINMVTLAIFALVIVIIDIALLFNHGKTFSEKENRVLQQAPELTVDSLTSGTFMTEAEDFISDQFMLRDSWISYKLTVDKIIGKKDAGGVYLGKNGYLIEEAAEPDEKNFTKNLQAIADFADEHSQLNVVMSVVPNAVCVCDQYLPNCAPSIDQTEIIDEIMDAVGGSLDYVDLTDTLVQHNTEYIYYKSDHHWTSLGAKYAFEALAGNLGITEPVESYDTYCVTNTFSGTLSSASGASYVTDDIDIYIPSGDLKYVVEYVGESSKSATIYSSAALETNSKYDVFLGGNHSLVKIDTSADSSRNLLVIKDSYANAFMQFVLPYYSTIYMVDPRYYSDSISNLVSEGEITDILILYNVNTFVEDNSIAGVLNEE